MGRQGPGGYDAVVHIARWAAANRTYLNGRLRQFGVTPERLWRMPAHVAMEWIYPILVDSVALPIVPDPTDLTGKGRMSMLGFIEYHITQQIYPTPDSWGTAPASVQAVAKMEAELGGVTPEMEAAMEAARAARVDHETNRG